uniref:Protein transport protein Sec61 subunit gamma n=6 Tax=Triticeae TaxID=147389 RepID=A0A8I6YRH6_HORVV
MHNKIRLTEAQTVEPRRPIQESSRLLIFSLNTHRPSASSDTSKPTSTFCIPPLRRDLSPPRAAPQPAMDAVDSVVDPLREFAKDSVRLVKRCHKPDRKEFTKVAIRTAIGFVVMGFVGFFVKLIFIPINNIIVGSG